MKPAFVRCYSMKWSPVLLTAMAVVAACSDVVDPVDRVSVVSTKSAFDSGNEPVIVTITNRSAVGLLVRDHSELARANTGMTGTVSVEGCQLPPQLPSGWVLLPPGETVTCRHSTAASYAPGDYQLMVVVQEGDTIWHGGLTPSNIFRLEN